MTWVPEHSFPEEHFFLFQVNSAVSQRTISPDAEFRLIVSPHTDSRLFTYRGRLYAHSSRSKGGKVKSCNCSSVTRITRSLNGLMVGQAVKPTCFWGRSKIPFRGIQGDVQLIEVAKVPNMSHTCSVVSSACLLSLGFVAQSDGVSLSAEVPSF